MRLRRGRTGSIEPGGTSTSDCIRPCERHGGSVCAENGLPTDEVAGSLDRIVWTVLSCYDEAELVAGATCLEFPQNTLNFCPMALTTFGLPLEGIAVILG